MRDSEFSQIKHESCRGICVVSDGLKGKPFGHGMRELHAQQS